jgi:hypothetical protein
MCTMCKYCLLLFNVQCPSFLPCSYFVWFTMVQSTMNAHHCHPCGHLAWSTIVQGTMYPSRWWPTLQGLLWCNVQCTPFPSKWLLCMAYWGSMYNMPHLPLGGHFWFPLTSKCKWLDENTIKLIKYSSWTTSAGFADWYAIQAASPDHGGDYGNLCNFVVYKVGTWTIIELINSRVIWENVVYCI